MPHDPRPACTHDGKVEGTARARCTLSSNTHRELVELVSKDGLYRIAAAAGVNTLPAIATQDAAAIAAWSLVHPAPYLLKPFYESIASDRPFDKNQMLTTREDLLDFVVSLATAWRCRSFAYLSRRDPGRGIARALALGGKFATFLGKKLRFR
ncbi:MAG: hypothetical protein ABI790_18745 [Betaproteobacteria bacterium]